MRADAAVPSVTVLTSICVSWLALAGFSSLGLWLAWRNLAQGWLMIALLALSLDEAVAELTKRFGPDPQNWKYGQAGYHHALIRHPSPPTRPRRYASESSGLRGRGRPYASMRVIRVRRGMPSNLAA